MRMNWKNLNAPSGNLKTDWGSLSAWENLGLKERKFEIWGSKFKWLFVPFELSVKHTGTPVKASCRTIHLPRCFLNKMCTLGDRAFITAATKLWNYFFFLLFFFLQPAISQKTFKKISQNLTLLIITNTCNCNAHNANSNMYICMENALQCTCTSLLCNQRASCRIHVCTFPWRPWSGRHTNFVVVLLWFSL